MNRIKLWPHAALIVLACAIVTGVAGLLWTRYERTAQAKELPGAARIERVNGEVGLNQSLDESAKTQWIAATANTPISVGDRLITRDNSQAEIAFTGRNFAKVDANSAMDVLELSDLKTQVALREGSALFDVGALSSGTLFEVATPCGAVDVEEPGIYRVDASESEKATATALSGRASVVGQGGTGRLDKGETLTIPCQGAAGAVRSQVDDGQAGALLDSYYRSRYPRTYDGRYRNYYTYSEDPSYFDPYRREVSYKYVSDYIPGVADLDDYGSWTYVNDYGYGWHPSVPADWAPYQSGYWTMDYPHGLTWVSSEPWGYAPYHYGRWTYASNEWFWIPEDGRSYPTYSPALVAFIPVSSSAVGWVALGPSDPYVPRYYDASWQPVYLSPRQEFGNRIANFAVPGAVTVVPAQQFTRVIDPRFITRIDAQTVARVRPVMDPLAVDQLRQAAFRTREGRARFDVPQAVAQRLNNTTVVTSTDPRVPFNRGLARTMRIEPVSDRARNQKLQIADQRATAGNGAVSQPANQATEQARERQMLELARQAGRGDRAARQQMQELRRQQFEQQKLDRANGQQGAQQAQGERVAQQQNQRALLRQQLQVQKEAARQQMLSSQQQRRAAAAQQLQVQREQRQQTEILRAQQRSVRHAEQPRQLPRQLKVQPAPQIRERKPPTQPRLMTPQPQVMRSQPNLQNGRQNERPAAPQATRQPRQVQPQPRPQPQGAQKHAEQAAPAAPKGQKKKPPQ